jgi:hypothetical protein
MAATCDVTPWSESLKNETRQLISEMRVAPDGFIHLKHKAFGSGVIAAMDLVRNSFAIKSGVTCCYFEDVEQLLVGGWVVD